MASLPLEVHLQTDTDHERGEDGICLWLDPAVNPTLSPFTWLKYIFEQVLTGGRSVTLTGYIGAGIVTGLVPLTSVSKADL